MIAVINLALVLADSDWHHMGNGWWLVMVLGMVLFWALVILGGVWIVREVSGRRGHEPDALEVLDRRFAEGAISPEDYRERRAILTGKSPQGEDDGS